MSTVTPYLCIKDAARAIDFYARAFGAVEPGARITDEDQFYGDRTGEITDPFGYRWTLSTHLRDVSDEELRRGAAARERQRMAAS